MNSSDGQIRLAPFQILERTAATLPAIASLEEEIHQSLSGLQVPHAKLRGKRIAVTCGSRGIADLSVIVRGICGWLKAQGAEPFVFPAMGSHGGATDEGQRKVLEEYGVTKAGVGAEVFSSMEAVSLGQTPEGFEVFLDANAARADAIIAMNRIKPHTDFSGAIESGLLKMLAVGAGKRQGAEQTHRAGRKFGPERVIRSMSAVTLASGKVLAGLAVVENEFHRIARVRAALPEAVPGMEEDLLVEAKRLVPRLPFEDLHLLVVDEMGKNISGTGMDTKVIGRGANFPSTDRSGILLIYVRDLTAPSAGNALGVGLADVIHERVFRKIDFNKTFVNVRTSLNPPMARTPMYLPTDREALSFALGALGSPQESEQRITWICNTLDLNRVAVSAPLGREALGLAGWRLDERVLTAEFNPQGDLDSPLASPPA